MQEIYRMTLADLEGARGTRAPPGPNSFNFMQFLGAFGKIVCWRPLPRELAPPPRGNPGSATECYQVYETIGLFNRAKKLCRLTLFRLGLPQCHKISTEFFNLQITEEPPSHQTMEPMAEVPVCWICGDEVESDVRMIEHILEKHPGPENCK